MPSITEIASAASVICMTNQIVQRLCNEFHSVNSLKLSGETVSPELQVLRAPTGSRM